jgi:hypothetical protein
MVGGENAAAAPQGFQVRPFLLGHTDAHDPARAHHEREHGVGEADEQRVIPRRPEVGFQRGCLKKKLQNCQPNTISQTIVTHGGFSQQRHCSTPFQAASR